ncbi:MULTISPECIES: hypothetical protein [unclassified Nonomuraea]|uniref:hypothetical protein n=1 Tax=unclassified Nonomuraea TaxID=2593643 RepID=UPI003400E0F9
MILPSRHPERDGTARRPAAPPTRRNPAGELYDLVRDRFAGREGDVGRWAGYGEENLVVGGMGVSGGTLAREVAGAETAVSAWRTR